MKKLLAVIVLSLGLSGVATAEEKTYTFQEFGHSVSQIPVKVGNHISNEIEKTKEYQYSIVRDWVQYPLKDPIKYMKVDWSGFIQYVKDKQLVTE